jgi:hypothetical protein
MGLSICVGFLSDLKQHDAESCDYRVQQFEKINGILAARGRHPHIEPDDVDSYSAPMYGYSGLHYLRRLATFPPRV